MDGKNYMSVAFQLTLKSSTTFVLFGKSQLYVTDSLPIALHDKFNVRPSVIGLFAGVRVTTGVSRSKAESRQVLISFITFISFKFYNAISFIYSVAVINVT